MSPNKSFQQIQAEHLAVQKELAALQNRQTRLNLLSQMQRQGVTRPDFVWFVAGGVR